MNRIYLDNNATTPPAPEVIQEHSAVANQAWANPSSLHKDGQYAKKVLDRARAVVARTINCQPDEIIFTGGGTEADNTAIRSAVKCHPNRGHIVCSAVEHDAVLHVVKELEGEGYQVSWVKPDANGQITAHGVARAMRPDTALVAVMAVNNETGIANQVHEIGAVVEPYGSDYLVDATQALGKVPLDFNAMRATYLVASAHKLHGLKGTGLLVARSSCKFSPLLLGGGQEHSKRAGTENVPGIAAFAKAIDLAHLPQNARAVQEVRSIRDQIQQAVKGLFGREVIVLGEYAPRVWNTLYVCFRGAPNRDILHFLDEQGIEVGIGSACSCLKNPQPSPTVKAMNVPHDYQGGSVRFSLSRYQAPSLGGDPQLLQRVVSALTNLSNLRKRLP